MENNPIIQDLLIGSTSLLLGLVAIGEAENYFVALGVLAMITGNNIIRLSLKKLNKVKSID